MWCMQASVGDNSINCIACHKWIHKRCSGISGRLGYVADFRCRRCLDGDSAPVVLLNEVELEPSVKVECVQILLFGGHARFWWRCSGSGLSYRLRSSLGKRAFSVIGPRRIHSLMIPEIRILYQSSVPGSKHTSSKLHSLPRLFPIFLDSSPILTVRGASYHIK